MAMRSGNVGRPRRKTHWASEPLIKFEVDFNGECHRNRLTIPGRRLEFPLAGCSNRLVVEAGPERLENLRIADGAIGIDDQFDDNRSLELDDARFFRIHRIWGEDGKRSLDFSRLAIDC